MIIHPIPYKPSANKYFQLLYGALVDFEDTQIEQRSLSGLFAKSRRKADRVLHIHWSHTLFGSRYTLKVWWLIVSRSLMLIFARLKGVGIVWTMHNALAHDTPHPTLDRIGRYILARIAHRIIVHNECGKPLVPVRAKARYVPHGHYIGAYGAAPRQGPALRELCSRYGIRDDHTVFCSLGMIRGYKQIPHIVRAFRVAAPANAILLIVGHANAHELSRVREAAGDDDRIIVDPRFVPDEEIPAYCASINYGVFNYDSTTLTSGGIIMMLSHGVPAIAPDTCGAELIDPGRNGFLFEDEGALRLLFRTLPQRDPLPSSRIVDSVRDYSWERVARETREVYNECV